MLSRIQPPIKLILTPTMHRAVAHFTSVVSKLRELGWICETKKFLSWGGDGVSAYRFIMHEGFMQDYYTNVSGAEKREAQAVCVCCAEYRFVVRKDVSGSFIITSNVPKENIIG